MVALLERPWTFKLPSRVVYNAQMRTSFLNSLADASIPLNKLARNVPHGIKGLDMLELLWSKRVNVERSGWFIQVVGAIEVVRL